MKHVKVSIVLLVTIISILTATFSFANMEYVDNETMLSFSLPDGWEEKGLDKERQFVKTKFAKETSDSVAVLVYGTTDIWNQLDAAEKNNIGNDRSLINNSILTDNDVKETFKSIGVDAKNVDKKFFNGCEYFYTKTKSSIYGYDYNVDVAIRCNQGYMYFFQFSEMNLLNEVTLNKDFESIMNTVTYQEPIDKTALFQKYSATNILFSILITICVYSLPIAIYRFAIHKSPIEPKKARIITIIYGVCALLVMGIFMLMINGSVKCGFAIMLWSYVNYRLLTSGYKNQVKEPLNNYKNESNFQNTERDDIKKEATEFHSKFCRYCGHEIHESSKFCNYCGKEL